VKLFLKKKWYSSALLHKFYPNPIAIKRLNGDGEDEY
jgi:hypothetical protein